MHNSNLVNSLVNNSSISHNDLVIEIGPGKGIITKALLTKKCKVIAIELDKKLADRLIEQFIGESNIVIENADFMTSELPSKEYKVFANIPFNMTAEIVQKLINPNGFANDVYLIMQYEAFLKYAGSPYQIETLRSLLYKPFFSTSIEYTFEPSDFYPIPKASIVLARFRRREQYDIDISEFDVYSDFINYIYSAPGSNLKEKTRTIFTYEQLKRLQKSCGVMIRTTLSTITYSQWIEMYHCFRKYVSPQKQSVINGMTINMERIRNNLQKEHKHRSNDMKGNNHG